MSVDTTIFVDGLLLHSDGGFDPKKSHKLCHQKQVFTTIASNKRYAPSDESLTKSSILLLNKLM